MWPALLPLGVAAAFLAYGRQPLPVGAWWDLLPQILLLMSGLLALRFGNGRVLAVAGLVWFGTHFQLSESAPYALATVVLMGSGFFLVAALPERGPRSWSALVMLLPVSMLGLVMFWPATWHKNLDALHQAVSLSGWMTKGGVSYVVFGLFLLASILLLTRLHKSNAPVDCGLFGVVIAWLLAYSHSGQEHAVYGLCTALMVFLTALETTHALAFRDQLTGLPSRRALERTLASLGGQYTLAMVDVDSFKKFNDRHGHDAGDEALRMIASHLRGVTGGGRAFRYGGEEFTVVFPNRNVEVASQHLEQLRQRIASSPFTLRSTDRPKQKPKSPKKSKGRGQVKVTVSIGAAQRSQKSPSTTAVLKTADKCLYKANRLGRNRLLSASSRNL